MADLADLYPGFASHWIDTAAGRVFARSGGEGPPLLLLHGYPQTNVMWHRVAPALAEHFSLIIPDLPGYGWSDAPRSDAAHAPYTKRAMAAAMIEVMEALGHVRFRLAGHDRGGRVAYRLALDHPGRLERLAVLDIVPTWAMWHRMDARLATRAFAWPVTIAAAASPIDSRSIIPGGSNGSPCSTSCRPGPCGTAWTLASPRAPGTGCFWRCRRRFPRR